MNKTNVYQNLVQMCAISRRSSWIVNEGVKWTSYGIQNSLLVYFSQINWRDYLEQLLFPVTGKHITDQQEVVVYGVDYLRNITALLTQTSNR